MEGAVVEVVAVARTVVDVAVGLASMGVVRAAAALLEIGEETQANVASRVTEVEMLGARNQPSEGRRSHQSLGA